MPRKYHSLLALYSTMECGGKSCNSSSNTNYKCLLNILQCLYNLKSFFLKPSDVCKLCESVLYKRIGRLGDVKHVAQNPIANEKNWNSKLFLFFTLRSGFYALTHPKSHSVHFAITTASSSPATSLNLKVALDIKDH